MKKILIADDHCAIRNGVKLILLNELEDVEFGEAVNASEVLKKMNEKTWDLIILDMDMPGRNGLEVLKQMKAEKCAIPVLMFSMHQEAQFALRALKGGAKGYLCKDSAEEELVKAMQIIFSGKKYITPSVAELLASQLEYPDEKAPHELLSDREYQTLLLIAKGKAVSQIADELSLSVATISTFRARILEKMGMANNAELTHYAIKIDLV